MLREHLRTVPCPFVVGCAAREARKHAPLLCLSALQVMLPSRQRTSPPSCAACGEL